MRNWSGRAHVERLRLWPKLSQTAERIGARQDVFAGVLLLGSLSRGERDAISDVDLVAVTRPGRWQEAWEDRRRLSAGALVTFDRSEDKPEIAGRCWLSASLVKVECLITAPGQMRLHGNVAVLLGEDDLPEMFERLPPLTPRQVDDYAADLRKTDAISDIERAYGDLIALLRNEIRSQPDAKHPPRLPVE